MATLLHDLMDTNLHSSKLGRSLTIPDSYVQWLCEHHHAANDYPQNSDLQLLQEADVRTSRYTRLLLLHTRRRQLTPYGLRDAGIPVYSVTPGIPVFQALEMFIQNKLSLISQPGAPHTGKRHNV